MKAYHVNVFYSDEDEGYIADIPEVRYCSAFGETPVEALREVENAKELWLETAANLEKESLDHGIDPQFLN